MELRCWSKAVKWNPFSAGSIIRFTSMMIYSIIFLDIYDFKAIGWKMPKGTGVDATVDNGAVVPQYKKRKHCTVKSSDATDSLVRAFESSDVSERSDVREDKRYALKVLLEFGTKQDKIRARKELSQLAFGDAVLSESEDDENVVAVDGKDSDSVTVYVTTIGS
jgi:hypothetical protein